MSQNFLTRGIVKDVGKQVTFNWAVTTHITTREQLSIGIRHFDFRAMPHLEHPNDIYFAHSLYARVYNHKK